MSGRYSDVEILEMLANEARALIEDRARDDDDDDGDAG
jgi:hypothetical protein